METFRRENSRFPHPFRKTAVRTVYITQPGRQVFLPVVIRPDQQFLKSRGAADLCYARNLEPDERFPQ